MIKSLLALAYPFVVCCMFYMCRSLFCDDHQLVDVSICEEHPWSTRRWWFHCLAIWAGFYYFGLSFGAMTHVLVYLLIFCFD